MYACFQLRKPAVGWNVIFSSDKNSNQCLSKCVGKSIEEKLVQCGITNYQSDIKLSYILPAFEIRK